MMILESIDHLNFAGKIYFLFYDTDIDLLFLTGQSKTNRFGIDFSRNITTNLEVHGEFAFITNQKKTVIDSAGNVSTSESDVVSYLLGIRYLSTQDTTYILEYYRNGTGYSRSEMEDYFSLINNGYDLYLAKGNNSLLKKAASVFAGRLWKSQSREGLSLPAGQPKRTLQYPLFYPCHHKS